MLERAVWQGGARGDAMHLYQTVCIILSICQVLIRLLVINSRISIAIVPCLNLSVSVPGTSLGLLSHAIHTAATR
jgi:hypothetical protein